MSIQFGEFNVDDIVDYLNQELPGFEPSVTREPSRHEITLRVRSQLRFASYVSVSDHLIFALHDRSYGNGLKAAIEEFIRKTRQDMIQKLGLQKEIDLEVQRKINAERQRIENEAYRKAMDDALARVAKEQERAREELAAGIWNTFMGRPGPTTTQVPDEE